MNVKRIGLFSLLAMLVGSSVAQAAAVPVKVNLAALRCVQNYELAAKDDDQIYLTVAGVAKGAEVSKRLPDSGTMEANPKKQPVEDKKPVALWEGELGDGEFALLTVTLYHGKGDDAAKAFSGKLAEAAKGVAEHSKKTLTADEAKNLAAATLKAQQELVTKVKESLSREKSTDHFGGMFNVLVWNNNGTLVKRLDPVGLTFGEHFGTDEKVYSKIKYTRKNVLVQDGEEYYPQEFPPITEDKKTIRVKMLESEYVKQEGKPRPTRNVADYLADLQVLAGDKPVEWKLGGENIGPSQVHMWWEFAE
jgi:hypothetical protein